MQDLMAQSTTAPAVFAKITAFQKKANDYFAKQAKTA
jgi:hypothetical protein